LNTFDLIRVCLAAPLIAVFGLASAQEAAADDAEIKHGEYLAIASDCEACHTAPGGKRLAGGLPIQSPLGTIYSTNITSSQQYGIGRYSLQQFSEALRRGIRADGAHLYPAMPYASYALLTDEDVKALYAYFTKAVPALDEPPVKTTSLLFPYNLRFSMAFWNALFLDAKPFTPDPSRATEWNRGKYLVDGPAHCGECHTPRGFLMQQDRSRQFAGAVLGSWYAPNITPDADAGIGAMGADELFRYLKFGKVAGKAQAGGEMGLAVQLSFSKLNDDDLKAIVTYVRSVPAIGDAETKARFVQGKPFTEVAKFRGVGAVSSDEALPGGAAQLFSAMRELPRYRCRRVTRQLLPEPIPQLRTCHWGWPQPCRHDAVRHRPQHGGSPRLHAGLRRQGDRYRFIHQRASGGTCELSFAALWQRGLLRHAADGGASPQRTSSQAVASDVGRPRRVVGRRLSDLARTLADRPPLVARTRLSYRGDRCHDL
jgi:mono/diheme cytochrome c family protein